MFVTAVVLAAGKGQRLKSKTSKPLIKINSRPMITYCLQTFSRHRSIKDIVLVVNSGNSNEIIRQVKKYRITKINRVVKGGLRRQDSVFKGLKAMDSRTDLVLIHDGARPFVDRVTLSKVIKEARDSGAAIIGVPVKATIKEVHGSGFMVQGKVSVKKTLNRVRLWEVQTPQAFKKDLILRAYKKFKDISVTDDAMLVEKLGLKISMVTGRYDNIKITTLEDLAIAKVIAKKRPWNTR